MPACPSWSTASTHYPLGAEDMAQVAGALRARGRRQSDRRLLRHRHVPHIAGARRHAAQRSAASKRRPAPVKRTSVHWVPAVASLYPASAELRQENAYPLHRRALQRQRLEANSASCRRQRIGTAASRHRARAGGEGSHTLDVCTAFVGRDEVADMRRGGSAAARQSVTAPLVIDSTELPVLERRSRSMAASRFSTRSISRTARSRRRSAWRWRVSSARR